jgi:hypothetical protein
VEAMSDDKGGESVAGVPHWVSQVQFDFSQQLQWVLIFSLIALIRAETFCTKDDILKIIFKYD